MIKKFRNRISVKQEFTLVSISIITSILIIYSLVQILSFSIFSVKHQKNQIEHTYKEINNELINISQNSKIIDSIAKISGENIRIYSSSDVLYETKSDKWLDVNLNNKEEFKLKFINFRPYILLDKPINSGKYNLQILQKVDILTEFMEKYLVIFIGILIISMSLSIVGSIYLSNKLLKRIKNLTDTMEGIKKNNINQRVPIEGSYDEFDRMNILFNSMMDEIQESFERQSQFSSDASHELKTPLTVLQGHLKMLNRWGKKDEEVLNNSINVCLDESDRMINLINELLVLSKVDNNLVNISEIDPINPIDIILEVMENYNMIYPDIIFNIGVIDERTKIKIKRDHLKQLLMITIDNSIKYNDKEIIKIDINLENQENDIILSIKDNGIGIEKQHISKVTDRFFKSDRSRQRNDSFGLGLSIAQRIMLSYNGKIKIESTVKEYTKIIFIFKK